MTFYYKTKGPAFRNRSFPLLESIYLLLKLIRDKKEYTNSGAIWKNVNKKGTQPDFNGRRAMNLKIMVGDTPFGAEPIKSFDDLVTYDKDGNAFPFLIKDASGKIVGVNAIFDISAWRRAEGAGEKSPALGLSFALSASKPNTNNEIPFPKEEEKRDNITQDDIPF